jgi:hypothetical protein
MYVHCRKIYNSFPPSVKQDRKTRQMLPFRTNKCYIFRQCMFLIIFFVFFGRRFVIHAQKLDVLDIQWMFHYWAR